MNGDRPHLLDIDQGVLFAALARHPRHTTGSAGHPLPDRCKLEECFDWNAIASELGTAWTCGDALEATFGSSQDGLLQTLHRRQGFLSLNDETIRERLGVIVVPNFIGEEEESRVLRVLRASKTESFIPWHVRDGGGHGASFGPSYRPNSGYKVDRSIPFTELPEVLRPVRARVEVLLRQAAPDCLVDASESGVSECVAMRVGTALRTFAMSSTARAGQQGPITQAFLQRYQQSPRPLGGVTDTSLPPDAVSQALGMHFDSRTENAEIVVGISMGAEPGYIFFSRRGPRKGQPFPFETAHGLHSKGEGLLVELPRRSLYMFFGLARYHLKHGVPWRGSIANPPQPYDRITVTFRSVATLPAKHRSSSGTSKKRLSSDSCLQESKYHRKLDNYFSKFEFSAMSHYNTAAWGKMQATTTSDTDTRAHFSLRPTSNSPTRQIPIFSMSDSEELQDEASADMAPALQDEVPSSSFVPQPNGFNFPGNVVASVIDLDSSDDA